MLGALVLPILNLLVLRWAGQGPKALGVDRPARCTVEFSPRLLVAGAFAASQVLLLARLAGFEWTPNPAYNLGALLEGLRWNVASVLYEELFFAARCCGWRSGGSARCAQRCFRPPASASTTGSRSGCSGTRPGWC